MAAPGKWWYVLGAVLLFGGCAGGGVAGFRAAVAAVESMQRVVVPGEHRVSLEAGEHTVYYEARSTVDGRVFSTGGALSDMRCGVTGPGGEVVTLVQPSVKSTYTLGGYDGVSLFELTAAQAGEHTLRCAYADAAGSAVVLAIGGGVMGAVVTFVAPAMLLGLAGLVLILIVYRKRAIAA